MSSGSSHCNGSDKFHVTGHGLGNNSYEKLSSKNQRSIGRNHRSVNRNLPNENAARKKDENYFHMKTI